MNKYVRIKYNKILLLWMPGGKVNPLVAHYPGI